MECCTIIDVLFHKMEHPGISEDAVFNSPFPARLEFLSTEREVPGYTSELKNSFPNKRLFLNSFLIVSGILCSNTTCSWSGIGRRSGRSRRRWSTSVTACTAHLCTAAGTASAATTATSNQVRHSPEQQWHFGTASSVVCFSLFCLYLELGLMNTPWKCFFSCSGLVVY